MLLVKLLLPCDVASTHILVCTSVLAFTGRNTVTSEIQIRLLVDVSSLSSGRRIGLDGLLLVFLKKSLALVKVVLRSHTSLSLWSIINHRSSSTFLVPNCCRPPAVRSGTTMAKIVEVVEHQVHVLLLLTLQVMNDPLILVYFDPYMRISLSRNGSWLYKLTLRILINIVTALRGIYIMRHLLPVLSLWPLCTSIKLLGSSTHALVVEFAALLLKLVVAHVEGIPAKTVVAHSHIVTKLEAGVSLRLILLHVRIFFVLMVVVSSIKPSIPENLPSMLLRPMIATIPIIMLSLPIPIRRIISINIMRTLLPSPHHPTHQILRITPLLPSSTTRSTEYGLLVEVVLVFVVGLVGVHVICTHMVLT